MSGKYIGALFLTVGALLVFNGIHWQEEPDNPAEPSTLDSLKETIKGVDHSYDRSIPPIIAGSTLIFMGLQLTS